jgi:hypothetical protein
MPTILNAVVSLTLVAVLAACATTSAPERQSQTDPNTNLAAYRSFGWKSAAGEGIGDEPMRMLDVNIRNGIRAELTRRGYTEVTTDPGFLVAYETAAQEKVKSNPVRFGIGVGSWGGNVGGSVNVGSPSVRSYREGRLVIHVIDAAANREVWFASVAGRVDQQKLDAEAVARVVAFAMQDFPPRS